MERVLNNVAFALHYHLSTINIIFNNLTLKLSRIHLLQ